MRAHSPGDDPSALARQLHQPLGHDDRLDHQHAVAFEQGLHLIADGGQRAVLDLHQTAAARHVNAIAVERHLELGILACVERLQVAVQRGFHLGAVRQ